MPNYQPGDILLLSFPFTGVGAKSRPALVLLDTGDDDVMVARVTSQSLLTQYDVEFENWQQAGLKVASGVRLHKIATLEKGLIHRQLGSLTLNDWTRVRAKIQQIWTSI